MLPARPFLPKTSIFISYARADVQFADQVSNALQEAGFTTWVDRNQLPAGEQWWQNISRAIADCAAVVVIVSQSSVGSEMVAQELQLAEKNQKRIIPILFARRGVPIGRFQSVQCIDFVEQPFLNACAQLMETIRHSGGAIKLGNDPLTRKLTFAPPVAPQVALAPLMDGAWQGHMEDAWGSWDLDIALAPIGRFQGLTLRPNSFETVTVTGSWRVEEPHQLTLDGLQNAITNPWATSPWIVQFFFAKVSPTLLEGFTLPERRPAVWRRR
jgi:hypothetical protein